MRKKDSVEYNLFNKFSIDTLESIITILDYSDNKNELYGLIHSVFMEKYEKNMDAFNGMNEFDDITRVLACNLAEIKSNAGSMSQEELVILKKILESAKENLSPEKICESLNAIIEENEDAIDKCLPDAVTNMEIESMLHKLSISALDALYIMAHNAHDKDIDLMKLIESEYEKRGFKNRKNVEFEVIQMEAGLNDFISNISSFNNRELKFLESVVVKSNIFITEVFTCVGVYEQAIFDCMSKLEERIQDEINSRNGKALTRC